MGDPFDQSTKIDHVHIVSMVDPGHTALYDLITAKARQNVISREAGKIKSNNFHLKSR
jgi:hypothetical protein